MPLIASDALTLLRNANTLDRLGHAYLITGPEGSGKRQLATELCGLIVGNSAAPLQHVDAHTVEPESKSRRIVIEQIRELERELHMRSSLGGRKAGVIFDADRLQPQASNAFLKTLEEPPAHTHLVMVTAFPDQLLETILSRCIEIPLLATSRPVLSARQQALLQILQGASRRQNADLAQVFTLVREFQRLLAEAKEAAQASGDAECKAEEVRYKQFADPKWFEEREKYFKALTESRYIGERSRLLETLEAWWADVLRQQAMAENAAPHLEFPDYHADTSALAATQHPDSTLRRSAALETLREQLGNTGIQEGLAIEVAFLKAFG